MIEISLIRSIAVDDTKVIMPQHVLKRFSERGIKYKDIISAILTGDIIEQYPADYPYPSCLILGKDTGRKYIHVVCGTDERNIWIVTAYYPSPDKWEDDMKTRKV